FRMLFVGSASYRPYEMGLAWFLREVWPRLAAADDVRLEVVGRPPRRPVHVAGVTYTGPVPSVAPHYERAHAVIVPVFEGSGTRRGGTGRAGRALHPGRRRERVHDRAARAGAGARRRGPHPRDARARTRGDRTALLGRDRAPPRRFLSRRDRPQPRRSPP